MRFVLPYLGSPAAKMRIQSRMVSSHCVCMTVTYFNVHEQYLPRVPLLAPQDRRRTCVDVSFYLSDSDKESPVKKGEF